MAFRRLCAWENFLADLTQAVVVSYQSLLVQKMELRLKLDPRPVLTFGPRVVRRLPFFSVSVANLFQGEAKAKELTARHTSELRA